MNGLDNLIQTVWPAWKPLSLLELGLLAISILLIFFSGPLLQKIWHQSAESKRLKSRLKVFRAFNFLIIFAILINHFILYSDSPGWAHKLLGVLMVIFSAFWAAQITRYVIRLRYGKQREFNNEKVFSETYNSRLLSLLATVFIIVIAFIGIIQVLGFSSLLEAGGMIGVVGVMLALTQAAWAPDIISGLIILNSGLVDEGDVIELEGEGDIIAMVYKTKLFHTELLNVVNNHRIMLGNAKLRGMLLQNLSKFASAKGLREVLRFKIAYDTAEEKIRACFQTAYDKAVADERISIEANHEMELRVFDAGDYAVEWAVYYYIKDIRNLVRTRQLFRAEILSACTENGISLATPDLQHITPQSLITVSKNDTV